MKLSYSARKVLAYVCVVAMIISSITVYNQASVKADGTATVNGIVYTVTNGSTTLAGFICQGIFDKARINFAWGEDVNEDTIKAKVNGKEVTVDGKSPRGMFIPLSEVSGLAEGEYQIVVSAVKTETSENVTGNATLKIEAQGEKDPSQKEWENLTEGFSYDDSTDATVVNIQQPDWAAQKGIYVSVPAGINKVSVNGVSDDTVGAINGAGVIIYLSALTYETNSVVIEYAGGTAEVIIKNENGTGGDAPQPETTTETPVKDGDELLSNTAFADATGWNEYGFLSAKNNGDGSVSLSVEAKTSGDNWSSQLVQNGLSIIPGKWYVAKYTVVSNVDKTFQLMIQSDGAAGGDWSIYAQTATEVKAGETTEIEMKFQTDKAGNKNVLFGIMMGYVNDTASAAANVVISDVSFKVYNSNPTELSTEAPTESLTEVVTEASTEAPTESLTEVVTEASTEAPTEASTETPTEFPTEKATEAQTEIPTEAPTVAPTEAQTVASTEKATAKNVTVGKTKVKSASKKKASKNVKISLKKVKDAKKYQVQVSATKNFKKVLVKKTVKKVAFTLKSKKIQNKKKLYVRARAIKVVGKKAYTGKWSKAKTIKIKK